eukprot:6593885-Alexandrium_andersonii.AAC.1
MGAARPSGRGQICRRPERRWRHTRRCWDKRTSPPSTPELPSSSVDASSLGAEGLASGVDGKSRAPRRRRGKSRPGRG